jgi:hypothetical protein
MRNQLPNQPPLVQSDCESSEVVRPNNALHLTPAAGRLSRTTARLSGRCR